MVFTMPMVGFYLAQLVDNSGRWFYLEKKVVFTLLTMVFLLVFTMPLVGSYLAIDGFLPCSAIFLTV